jgi:hypothetical protein
VYSDGLRTGGPGFGSRQGQESFLSRPALWLTQPLIQWVPEDLPSGVTRPTREADYLPPSGAEVKNGGATPPLPHTFSLYTAQLNKHRDNFAFN